jgi:hypothetical protein
MLYISSPDSMSNSAPQQSLPKARGQEGHEEELLFLFYAEGTHRQSDI